MKKGLLSLIIILSIITIFVFNKKDLKNNDNVLKDENINLTGINSLAIMIQDEDGSYKLSESDMWPGDGYVFNQTLSKCENGGKLSWNEGKVTLKTSSSDKCYVYFDKYNSLKIEEVEVDDSEYNTIKLTVHVTGGTGNYKYSVQNTCTQCNKLQEKCGLNSTDANIFIKDNLITISNLEGVNSNYLQTFTVKVSDGQTEEIHTISNVEVNEVCPGPTYDDGTCIRVEICPPDIVDPGEAVELAGEM